MFVASSASLINTQVAPNIFADAGSGGGSGVGSEINTATNTKSHTKTPTDTSQSQTASLNRDDTKMPIPLKPVNDSVTLTNNQKSHTTQAPDIYATPTSRTTRNVGGDNVGGDNTQALQNASEDSNVGTQKETSEPTKSSEVPKNRELSEEQQKEVDELKKRDIEVRAHEQAHAAVGGQYAGAPTYEYQTGPDGRRYAVGGQVSIDISEEKDPQATIQKMQVVKRAALAPAEPSAQDYKVAAEATQKEQVARSDLAKQNVVDMSADDTASSTSNTSDNTNNMAPSSAKENVSPSSYRDGPYRDENSGTNRTKQSATLEKISQYTNVALTPQMPQFSVEA